MVDLPFMTNLALLLCTSAHATDWYVSPDGTGNGSEDDPFGTIQEAIDAVEPGDAVHVAEGTYTEALSTGEDGTEDNPIRLTGSGDVWVEAGETVFQIDHAWWSVTGLSFDAQYAEDEVIKVGTGADYLQLTDIEVAYSSRDCVEIDGPTEVIIDDALIHHCLNATNGRSDAHGIVAGPVQGLTIRSTEIHTFSGDAIQLDPSREEPGWRDLSIEGCTLWLEPLESDTNGFEEGVVTGENGLDTRTFEDAARASVTIKDTSAWGFRNGLVSNMAALHLREGIDANIEGLTVWDSDIALRVRGPTSTRPMGAWATLSNGLIYNVDTAVRYEDNVETVAMRNVTLGLEVGAAFVGVDSDDTELELLNLLVLAEQLPEEATDDSNMAVDETAFTDAEAADYHLEADSLAIDGGIEIEDLLVDLDGTPRPSGASFDIGAFEWTEDGPEDPEEDDGEEEDSEDDTSDDAEEETMDYSTNGVVEEIVLASELAGEVGGFGCATAPGGRHWALALALLGWRRRKRSVKS